MQMTVTLIPARVSGHAGMQGLARDTHTCIPKSKGIPLSVPNKATNTFYLYFFSTTFSPSESPTMFYLKYVLIVFILS